MSQLRKEYDKNKKRYEKIVDEAAFKWLEANVIVLNERIDRTTVSRLIDSIQKFEETFGDYKHKLPAIGSLLNAAETGLQMVVTGKTNDKKASNMLKQLTYLYSTLSDFFTRDLPVLMRAPIFFAAKESPEQRLDMVRSYTGMRYDPYVVRDALANALRPSKDEKRLLGKIYRSTKLPKLDVEQIASQMLLLSYNDLEELTKVGKVPMVATEDELEEQAFVSPSVDEKNTITPELDDQNLPTPAVSEAWKPNALSKFINETPVKLMLEQDIDLEKLQKLNKEMEKLRTVTDKLKQAPSVKKAVDQIDDTINRLLAGEDKPSIIQKVKQLFGGRPAVEKNIADVYTQLKSFQQVWPALKQRLGTDYDPDQPLEQALQGERLAQVKSLLAKALTQKTKGGIPVDTLVSELMNASVSQLDNFATGAPLTMTPEQVKNIDGAEASVQNTRATQQTEKPGGTEATQDATGARETAGTTPAAATQQQTGQKTVVPSVEKPDLAPKAQELGITPEQLAKALQWVGVKIEG